MVKQNTTSIAHLHRTKNGTKTLGDMIDLLITSNISNWNEKEYLNKTCTRKELIIHLKKAFQENKIRNRMITNINFILHKGPKFHFRNYHNY